MTDTPRTTTDPSATDGPPDEPDDLDELDDLDAGSAALVAALVELERYVAESGWDRPPRLFALVHTDDLLAAEPALADRLRPDGVELPDGALTAVEQEDFLADGNASADLLTALGQIVWPDSVFGCALATERTFLPATAEADLPDDPAEAAAYVADHPQREDVRVVVGADRSGHRHGVGRLSSRPEDLLGGADLVPGLSAALAHTLT